MNRVDKLRQVVKERVPGTVDGVEVDYKTARRLLGVYAELGAEDSKESFEVLPMETVVRFAYTFGQGKE